MNDYYPFGMLMPGRQYYATSSYRYGFNGKESDNEVKGEGNQQDYGMRIYDPRLGRFLSVDPLTKSYPHYTPYSYAGNKPIRYIDLDGMEEGDPWDDLWSGRGDAIKNIGWILQDMWNGKGKSNAAIDNFNKNLNPVGIVIHDGYTIGTGKDLTYNTPRSRSNAFFHLGTNAIMYASGQKFFGQFNATPAIEEEMNFTRMALQSSAKPKVQQPALQLTNEERQAVITWIKQNSSSGTPLKVPQGLSEETFKVMSQRIANRVGDISTDVFVQGSRASGTASANSDLDIGIRVSGNQFDKLIKQAFGSPAEGSAKWKTMQYSIQTGEAKLRDLRSNLENLTGMKVQVSIIKEGGKFDNGAQLPTQAAVRGGVH